VDPTERTATLSTYFTAGGVLMDTIPVFVTPFNQGELRCAAVKEAMVYMYVMSPTHSSGAVEL
jgi:hypothetical protein